jgi:hypothetical protein
MHWGGAGGMTTSAASQPLLDITMEAPDRCVYFYETTRDGFRLFYCIPPQELRHMTLLRRAQRSVLRDYPDGIDLGVSPDEFDAFRTRYRLNLPKDPRSLSCAFAAIWLQGKKPFPATGYLEAQFLNTLARRLRMSIYWRIESLNKYMETDEYTS